MRSVLNLVKTNNGYSLIEGDNLLNKTANTKTTKEKAFANPKSKFPHIVEPVQNFTIYPYIPTRPKQSHINPANVLGSDRNQANQTNQNMNSRSNINICDVNTQKMPYPHRFFIIPARSQWFSINSVHQIQKKALPQWFKQKKVPFGTVKGDKFEKNQQLYKKYRNHIIDLAKQQYVTAYNARAGLAGDVCSIIRIHDFLEKWGLINYVFSRKQTEKNMQQEIIQSKAQYKSQKNQKIVYKNTQSVLSSTNFQEKNTLRKDCFDKEKHLAIASKNFTKEDLELLKKITKQMRPFCHYCEGICGVLWFEYKQDLVLKRFTSQEITDAQNSQGVIQTASQPFQYILRLCSSCYYQGNLPFILSMNNFQKKSIIDSIESSSQVIFRNLSNISSEIIQRAHKSLNTSSESQPDSAKENTKRTRSSTHNQNGGFGNHVTLKDNLNQIENQAIKAIQSTVELLEKNKLNFKKTVDDIQIKAFTQSQLLKLLLHVAVKRLEKLKNIDVDSQLDSDICQQQAVTKETKENQNRFADFMQEQQQISIYENEGSDNAESNKKSMEDKFEIIGGILKSQKQAYQQFMQLWIIKMGVKLEKLGPWDQTVNWCELQNKSLQKQAIAEALRNIKIDSEQSQNKQ